MREDYASYQERIGGLVENHACFPALTQRLQTSQSLALKFDPEGYFRQFYGDTVVFPLTKEVKQSLEELQKSLYKAGGGLLSEKLPADTFHITLHDLSADQDFEVIEGKVREHGTQLQKLWPSMREKGKLRLKAVGMVSMVSCSIVLLLEPEKEADQKRVQELYAAIDEICPFSYPLTLHVTLAYYKPGVYAPEEWSALARCVLEQNQTLELALELDSEAMEYQLFTSMKDYVEMPFDEKESTFS